MPRGLDLPPDIDDAMSEAWALARDIEGALTLREVHFLALAMASTPAAGATVEIGSFKGRSTVALASVARRYGLDPVVAIDPHTGPSITDPPLGATGSSYETFISNLEKAGIREHVDVRRAFSRDVAARWEGPIRFLRIDGDYTYGGALEDWRIFQPHLVPGAIVALHDVLHAYEGPIRVFVEEILRSPGFGAAGFVGSVGWAQYQTGLAAQQDHARARASLARRAQRLIPYTQRAGPLRGLKKIGYKLSRWRVPHGPIDPGTWARMMSSEIAVSHEGRFTD